jgi:hypothetical protein
MFSIAPVDNKSVVLPGNIAAGVKRQKAPESCWQKSHAAIPREFCTSRAEDPPTRNHPRHAGGPVDDASFNGMTVGGVGSCVDLLLNHHQQQYHHH